MTEPLLLTLDVACPAGHAFEVWTGRTTLWWPVTHTVSAESGLKVVMEAHVGGRIYERTAAGVEHDWGEITVWDPPHRLVYWWFIRRDRADATEVEIQFLEQPDGTTHVVIEHRGWERLGALGPGWREVNLGGWSGVLPSYTAACAAAPAG